MKVTSYLELFKKTDWDHISQLIEQTQPQDVEKALSSTGGSSVKDFAALISPIASERYLEEMAKLSNFLTERRFGKAIRLFAPMYLSNECNNVCDYCGFSLGNKIPRKTLSTAEIIREASVLKS